MNLRAHLRVFFKADDGLAFVELALLFPVLALLMFGSIDLGRAYFVGLEVADAAHAGAEYGAQNPTDATGISAAATNSAKNLQNLNVTSSWGCECSDGSSFTANCAPALTCVGNANRGANVVHRMQVQAQSVYTTWVPWPGIPSSITVTKTATVRSTGS